MRTGASEILNIPTTISFRTLGECGTQTFWSFSHESFEICIGGDEGGTIPHFSIFVFRLFLIYKYTLTFRTDLVLVWQLLWTRNDTRNSGYSKSVAPLNGTTFLSTEAVIVWSKLV